MPILGASSPDLTFFCIYMSKILVLACVLWLQGLSVSVGSTNTKFKDTYERLLQCLRRFPLTVGTDWSVVAYPDDAEVARQLVCIYTSMRPLNVGVL